LFARTDLKGPRFGIGLCIGLTAPAVYCIGLSTNAAGFIISRLFIGFSLATFVACQFWCTSMFNTKVVGAANAIAAGWVSVLLLLLLLPVLAACMRLHLCKHSAWAMHVSALT
jgi:nitrate/nitrite transporter NarK